MKKVNNKDFSKFFEEKDSIKYYYDCMNIENAGQSKTAVKSMEYVLPYQNIPKLLQ